MRIPVRIAIVCLLPLLGFTVFAGMNLLDKQATYSKSERLAKIAQAAPSITALVHQLQIERGASAGFLNSKGRAFGDTVRNQRPVTDAALSAWQQGMAGLGRVVSGTRFGRDVSAVQSKLAGLSDNRKGVDAASLSTAQSTQYYTSVISTLIGLIDVLGGMADDGRIVQQATVWTALVRRKEYAGQERAMGAAGFGAGQFSAEIYQKFLHSRAMGDAQADILVRNASQAQVDFVARTLKGSVTDEFMRLRAAGAAAPFTKSTGGVTGPQWFGVATKYIDTLKTVEDQLAKDFLAIVDTIVGEARWGFWNLLTLFLGLLAITGVLTVIVALSITRPIARLVSTMAEMAQGHNDADVPGVDRGDEIGKMARAVLVFRDAALEKIRLEGQTEEQRRQAEEERQRNADAQAKAAEERAQAQAKTAEEQAQVVRALAEGLGKLKGGDLTFRLSGGFTDAYAQIKDDFNAAIEQLQEMIRAITNATREVTNASAEISTSTTDLSQRTEEQAASLEQTSASMEQISATVKKNAENAGQANQFASSTRDVADRGGEVVAHAVDAMARIEDSSRKIADIIGVIDEIARQTNLLALNAAVEAARAGEAGRGFAVVASEVRSLAQRSSQAAKDIKDLITNSSGQVKEGVELVNKAGASLTEIVESIKKVAEIVSDIANASAEQATGLDQINKALTQMDEVTQQNSALVEENAATAKTLEHQSMAMNERVAFFRLDENSKAQDAPRMAAAAAPAKAGAPAAAKPRPVATAKRAPAPTPQKRGLVGRMQTAVATAFQDDPDWKEF